MGQVVVMKSKSRRNSVTAARRVHCGKCWRVYFGEKRCKCDCHPFGYKWQMRQLAGA